MNIFFTLIDTIQTPQDQFDASRYNEIVRSFGVNQYDDFLTYFAFFLYEFPLNETHQKIFDKKRLDGKLGITTRHLIKTAKRLGVDQNLIDHYFTLKRRKELYSRSLQRSEKEIEKIEEEIGKFDYGKYYHTILRYERNSNSKKIYGWEFNNITFKLIKSVLESK